MPPDSLSDLRKRFEALQAAYRAGQLAWEQYAAQVADLRASDAQGRWWSIDPRDGKWLFYDGQAWVPGKPPKPPAPQPVAPAAPAAEQSEPAATPSPAAQGDTLQRLRTRLIAQPLLALVPSLACGGIWFLYTFLGVFKYEGIRGVDLFTPIVIIGVPLALWFLKKPLDKLLAPLNPLLARIPTPARYGITLGVALTTGCGCATLSMSGYGGLNFSALVTILVAAVLTRKVEVPR